MCPPLEAGHNSEGCNSLRSVPEVNRMNQQEQSFKDFDLVYTVMSHKTKLNSEKQQHTLMIIMRRDGVYKLTD
jgi:hypothetical protein